MNKINNTRGSIWRIWDLHVHSPASYGGSYEEFIQNASKSEADVIGINDYSTIQGYKEILHRGGIPNKIIFPVVEFRMHNIVANRKNIDPTKAGTKINFHIIFNNAPEVINKIDIWMNSLECFSDKGKKEQLGNIGDLKKVSFDFDKVIESLKDLDLHSKHALIWLPYDEYGGIDEIDSTDNFFKLSLINKSHIIGSSSKKQIEFFNWQDSKFTIKQFSEWFDSKKPCIKGSDAHKNNYPFGKLQNSRSEPIERYCWINADATFEGLKRILKEPDRVFIGDKPDLLKRLEENKTKFIRSLSIKKIEDSKVGDTWFENFNLELNSSLVAVIGNKGSGKSAITDIIGLCGNTYQKKEHFSFLTKDKFRKPRPLNLADNFQASLVWEDGKTVIKGLNENSDITLPERVRYIPQNFLETLCANVEKDDFEKELKQIIYSHTPEEKRLEKSSLDELIEYKSSLINDQIDQIKNEISKINKEIVFLEEKNTPDFRKSVEEKLKLKKDELNAHLNNKPIAPPIKETSVETNPLIVKINNLRTEITRLEDEIKKQTIVRTQLNKKLADLHYAEQSYEALDNSLKNRQTETNEFVQILINNGISSKEVFDYKINLKPLRTIINITEKELLEIDTILSTDNINGLFNKKRNIITELKVLQEELDKPAKENEKYVDDLKRWKEKESQIIGDIGIENTIKYFEKQIEYLENYLENDLVNKHIARRRLLIRLFTHKIELVKIREELFQPLTQFIENIDGLKLKYDVKVDVQLQKRDFEEDFLSFINQGKLGSFLGKDDGYKRLLDLTEKADLESEIGIIGFVEEIIDNLIFDKRISETTKVDISKQLKQGKEVKELYDFLFHLEYIQPFYNLKLGDKTLSELSPGERGALLLIFYLILDNDDIPLIIDQPEDNLDNESIYNILVHFIKKVKDRRQIIIVTHNPNLAVVCDADQIIHIQIEKNNKNAVKFVSASIENEVINKSLMNVLEGTPPAFDNRDSKYYIRGF
jgi:ABC-type lipoprotein export system ATPase subunit